MADRACSVEGCGKPTMPRFGLCSMHYTRMRRHGSYELPRKPAASPCAIPDCTGRSVAHGWCRSHYLRSYRFGDPLYRGPGEVVDGLRVCTVCGVEKPVNAFPRIGWQCSGCVNKRARARYAADPKGHVEQVVKSQKKYADKTADRKRRRRAVERGARIEVFDTKVVMERDGWICQLCFTPIDLSASWPHPLSQSLDHILPLSRGGDHSLVNCQATHLSCNIRKGARVTEVAS